MKTNNFPPTLSVINIIKFLIFEQDITQQYLLECILKEGNSIELFFAQNKEEIYTIIEQNPSIDFIIIEPYTARYNGFELMLQLKETQIKAPIIALTVYALHHEKEKCFKYGCDYHISKPFDPDTLLSIIQKEKALSILE